MRPSLPVVSDSGERARGKKGAEQEVGQGWGHQLCGREQEGLISESKLGMELSDWWVSPVYQRP